MYAAGIPILMVTRLHLFELFPVTDEKRDCELQVLMSRPGTSYYHLRTILSLVFMERQMFLDILLPFLS